MHPSGNAESSPIAKAIGAVRRGARLGRTYGPLPIRAVQGERFGRTLPTGRGIQSADTAAGANPLEQYFDANHSGPGIWKWRHYFDIYHHHFAPFVGKAPTILEIGVYSGGSLGMWHSYFGAGSRVIGVDIEEACRAYENDATKIYVGDQADPQFWADLCAREPKIDMVVDDGGHLPYQQIATLEALLPRLSPGGVFLCEDLTRRHNPFVSYVTGLSRNLFQRNYGEPNPVQRYIESVTFYPYVVAITRRRVPLAELHAPMHGTEWQPFIGWAHERWSSIDTDTPS